MTRLAPDQEWWTVAEIAEAALADLPATRQGVEAVVRRLGWRGQPGLARRRQGRGGGWEYHWQLFPQRAQRALLARSAPADRPAAPRMDRAEAWEWFEGLPEAVQAVARRRLDILLKVEALEAAATRFVAVRDVSRVECIGSRSVWAWAALVDGVRRDDWLPYLAPRHRAAVRRPARKAMDCEFFDALKADFLRPAAPSFASCYRRAVRIAAKAGWQVVDEQTARRRLKAEVSGPTQVLARKGVDALKRLYPSQTRDKAGLHAMEAVNADVHKFDVFVRWPAAPGEAQGIVTRPQMVAFQDIHSGRILAWRIDQTPNATAVRLAAGDMIEAWGIPEHVVLDNGREFAAKALTGGTPTRYRFRVREDDLPGLFVSLGCTVHWATPYSGQSKPIERAFRDMCDAIAKDPRFDGAWTGNRPEAKPEDYGRRAVDLEAFIAVVGEGIEEHNTRPGRWSEVAAGRSFAEVFDASYAVAPIRKATEAQRRLWLMGAEGLRAATGSGLVKFLGNEYWAPWMTSVAGERVIVRFDPADLWSGLHIYRADNGYVGHAPCREKAGFFDLAEARTHSRARRTWMNAEKAALEAHRRMKAADVAALLSDAALPRTEPVEARVVRPVFGKPARPSAAPALSPDVERAQAEIVADLAARRARPRMQEGDRERIERFRRAILMAARLEAGGRVPAEDQRWLIAYRETPEHAAMKLLHEDFGDAIFG
jgi:hypothetical protein